MKSRRRFLSILGATMALPLLGRAALATTQQWRGVALGANAQIILDHPNAAALIQRAVSEIHRLEGIFSLYRNDSALSRLNRTGQLVDPPFEMIELLSICSGLNARTQGAFDPSVQPLWALYARSYAQGSAPDAAELNAARDLSGWRGVLISSPLIRFARDGMALTLNGVAQGYIADKVAALLRAGGVNSVLVNTGEITAIGTSPEGGPWPVEIKGLPGKRPLHNQAIATSAPLGTVFDAGGKIGHILDPRSGLPGGNWQQVSVISKSAAVADGLSTGFCLMTRKEIMAAKRNETVILQI